MDNSFDTFLKIVQPNENDLPSVLSVFAVSTETFMYEKNLMFYNSCDREQLNAATADSSHYPGRVAPIGINIRTLQPAEAAGDREHSPKCPRPGGALQDRMCETGNFVQRSGLEGRAGGVVAAQSISIHITNLCWQR